MPDWSASMQQTYEFYKVDPDTWGEVKKIDFITSGSVEFDSSLETKGSASFVATDVFEDQYIRPYLMINQNKQVTKYPLGTYLCTAPGISFSGKNKEINIDGYSPLVELKEKLPPVGYSVLRGKSILDTAYSILFEQMRGPAVRGSDASVLDADFVANMNDTWLTFITDFIGNIDYELGLDELGRVLFMPIQDINSLSPRWTYSDNNSSILQPQITVDRDIYNVPNVVEVIYSKSNNDTNNTLYSIVKNTDKTSSVSIPSRGREVVYRETDPKINGEVTKERLDIYANRILKEKSALEYKLTYTHGYCPVRVGDCVLLNYERAGLTNIKAKVISQRINLTPGCQVEETAVFSSSLWG